VAGIAGGAGIIGVPLLILRRRRRSRDGHPSDPES
jgi:hypothetical protein